MKTDSPFYIQLARSNLYSTGVVAKKASREKNLRVLIYARPTRARKDGARGKKMIELVEFAILFFIAALIGYPLYFADRRASGPALTRPDSDERASLLARRSAGLIELNDLENDYSSGKIERDQYEESKTRIDAIARQISDRIGVASDRIERARSASADQGLSPKSSDDGVRNFCPQCGVKLDPNQRFCHQCGVKLN